MTVPSQAWSGTAFGLSLESDFELPGMARVGAAAGALRIRRAASDELRRGWPAASTAISVKRGGDGRVATSIRAHPQAGFLFEARGVGYFQLSADGAWLHCPEGRTGLWLRYLIGQVLPFASVVRGLEVFHASAVRINDSAIGFFGRSGAGKSTMALNLHHLGAAFMTDDVLAVSRVGDGVHAHSGFPTAKVRTAASDLVALGGRTALERTQEITLLAMTDVAAPSPLATAVFLSPERHLTEPRISRVEPADPELLLQSTFNFVLDSKARLRNHLATCAAVWSTADILLCELPERAGIAEAAAILDHLDRPSVQAGKGRSSRDECSRGEQSGIC